MKLGWQDDGDGTGILVVVIRGSQFLTCGVSEISGDKRLCQYQEGFNGDQLFSKSWNALQHVY